MRNTLFSPIAAAAFGLALTASAASAQDAIVYDAYDDYPPPYEIVEVPPPRQLPSSRFPARVQPAFMAG